MPSPALLQSAPPALLRRLEWRARGMIGGAFAGEYRSVFRGRGMEFDQVVKYEYGDDVRDIDWNVTARLGEPYRKKFIEEREITIVLLFEDTPSLQFGSASVSKREALLELAGLLFLLAAVNRDRIGFARATPDACEVIPPARGRGAIHRAAERLLGATPPPLSDAATGAVPWAQLPRLAPRHSILVWLGDFAQRPVPSVWPAIQDRYQTLGFRVDDPWDSAFPCDTPAGNAAAATGGATLYDPLDGRLCALDDSAAARAAHARWREARETRWRELFPDSAARLVVPTTQNRLDALARFFRTRQCRQRPR